MSHISAPDGVSATVEHNLFEPEKLLQSESEKQFEYIHTEIANMSKLIRDWEENHQNSLTNTVVKYGFFKDGEIYSI